MAKKKADTIIDPTPEGYTVEDTETPVSNSTSEGMSYDKQFMNDLMGGLVNTMTQGNNNQGNVPAWFQNMFQGQIQPMQRPRQRAKPVYEDKMVIDDRNGTNFTQVKIYVHSPTMQYPTASIFFQAANAKGSCFMRLDNTIELEQISDFCLKTKAAIDGIMPQLKQQEVAVNQQLNQYDQTMKVMRSGLFQDGQEQ